MNNGIDIGKSGIDVRLSWATIIKWGVCNWHWLSLLAIFIVHALMTYASQARQDKQIKALHDAIAICSSAVKDCKK